MKITQIDKLEESLRKERETRIKAENDLLAVTFQRDELERIQPTWKLLSEFRGLLPVGTMVAKIGEEKQAVTYVKDPKHWIDSGFTLYFLIPEAKLGNRDRLAELEKELTHLRSDLDAVNTKMRKVDEELKKLKEE